MIFLLIYHTYYQSGCHCIQGAVCTGMVSLTEPATKQNVGCDIKANQRTPTVNSW